MCTFTWKDTWNVHSLVSLNVGICSEKCVIRGFGSEICVIRCIYTNVDGIACYTPRLYGIFLHDCLCLEELRALAMRHVY
jgi:hypothetical protein